ncbi:glycoside hydrolase family 2 protein [Microlunatus parietis]|uniref:beta-mannosidase n=1 Tax=Microlunatus parietis TaxID=682979 RepID=A0A7Y9I6R2_9ACTN|nr:glycoside hydrolase family 2 protein [Microlunatus parietis]NYE70789.1 beta-mannosidase [Microlunatus parietis]
MNAESLTRTDLGSAAGIAWTLSTPAAELPAPWSGLAGATTPATVPGEVYADLLTAGLIPDPFDGDNEAKLAWIGRTDWSYRATFSFQRTLSSSKGDRHDLVTDGLDTVATITLNGTEVGRTANQHRGYRFDVTSLLVDGDNELVIDFEGPATAARRLEAELGDPRPASYAHPYNAIRKAASTYGWDWGPDLAGAGIWRPIGIESWSTARIAAVRPLAAPSPDGGGVLTAHVDLEWAAGATEPTKISVEIGGHRAEQDVAPGTASAVIMVEVPDAELWWPVGYGEQPLYPVTVTLGSAPSTGSGIDTWRGRVGFRTVEISTAPDRAGSEFVILVNGRRMFVKGANWIPDDALITRTSRETYLNSIMDARDSGMNLLRVWGGGFYESEDFYDLCDELGILVWQDFLFACAAYAEEEPLASEVEAEARQAITRLSRHASLAVWNGNNENLWGYVDWGWKAKLGDLTWGDGYYSDLLPALVAELDPRTPYTAGSPSSPPKYHYPNDYRHGTMHIWDVWNRVDYAHYRDYPARFVAEFGFQGPPAWSTLTSVVHDQPLDPFGPQMLVHQKAGDGNLKLQLGLGDHLPMWSTEPFHADDWHWTTQLNQARAVGYGIAHFRSLHPLNSGTVVWQLNDQWPVISWAAVDSTGIRKPLWYALKAVYADRLITVQPRPASNGPFDLQPIEGQAPAVIIHNDSDEPWSGTLSITRRSTGLGSETLAEQEVTFEAAPRSAVTIEPAPELITPEDPTAEFLALVAEGAADAYWYFVEDTSLRVHPQDDAATVTVVGDGGVQRVTVRAEALIKDLAIFPDRLDPAARVDSGLITLTAGQSHTFVITAPAPLDEAALTTRPVLRSVNDLITG